MAHSFANPSRSPPAATRSDSTETLQSPLHRLEAEFRGMPYGLGQNNNQKHNHNHNQNHNHNNQSYKSIFDAHNSYEYDPSLGAYSSEPSPSAETDSIYSFDSVSTSGRLLDRLDIAADDMLDHDAYLRRRESMASIHSTGRLLDRLGLEDSSDDVSHMRPILPSPAASLGRLRSLNRPPTQAPALFRQPSSNTAQNHVVHRAHTSHDSLHGDFHSSSGSLLLRKESSGASKENSLPIHKENSATSLTRPPDTRNFYESSGTSSGTVHSGLRSVSASSSTSSISMATSSVLFNPCARFDHSLEAATKQALKHRAQGNHREASYQLQLLANTPHNYPKAMYLYAKALALGQGVKQNESQYVRWLCKCVVACTMLENTACDLGMLNNYMLKVGNSTTESLLALVKQHVNPGSLSPHEMFARFNELGAPALSKLISLNSADKNVVGGAYFLLGEALVLGNGVQAKEEDVGRLLLAKSASLAYADAMVKLGELWCAKSKGFKKDYYLASAWLRLGELFGKKDIGNSWIYKDKYLEKKKK